MLQAQQIAVFMKDCLCGHPLPDHREGSVCEELIHYPSEDYPCLCESHPSREEKCAECGHASNMHLLARRCWPEEGYCSCLTPPRR